MKIKHFIALFASLACIALAGCSNNGGSTSGSSSSGSKAPIYVQDDIKLNESNYIMEINSKYQLNVANSNLQYVCTWTSSNNEVATVDFKGSISALSVGSTSISASYNGLISTCKIVVVNSHNAPYILVDFDDITIGLDQYFNVNAEMYYKGEIVDKAVLQWHTDDAAVASIDGGGKNIDIIGSGVGETTCVVSTTYEDKYVSAVINVKVVSDVASVIVINAEICDEGYSLSLKYDEYFTPIYLVYVDGVEQKNAVIQWRSDNPSIVSIDDGCFIGTYFGTTTVHGNFLNLCEVVINISVEK